MTATANLKTEGMHCASCSMLIEMTLQDLEGIGDVKVDMGKGITTVTYDEGAVTTDAMVEAIEGAGYSATPI